MRAFLSFTLLTLAMSLSAQVIESDSNALVTFYNENGGSEWTQSDNWLNGPVSTWFGVTVVEDRVTRLELYNNGVTGTFPTVLTTLDALIYLELSRNDMTGILPGEIGNLSALEYLGIDSNEFTGELPESLGNCTNLRQLSISSNAFEGSFPMTLSNASNLTIIWAHKNAFGGSFPEVFKNMPWLETLVLEENGYEGQVPGWIDSLKNLRAFYIDRNNFSGPMPKVHNLTNLSEFHLCCQDLEGDMDTILGYHPNLYYFTPFANKFTGHISTSHFNPEELELVHFNENLFSSVDPGFYQFGDTGVLSRLYLSRNMLDFDDLAPLANAPIANFQYNNQARVGSRDTVYLETGHSYTMSSSMENADVVYQWYFDNDTIPGATGKNYTIENFDTDQAGSYHFDARHPDFPELTLLREYLFVLNSTVGVAELAPESWRIYPNPAGDVIHVELDVQSDLVSISVYDMTGQCVMTIDKGFQKQNVDLESLMPGVYSVVLTTDSASGRKLLVKKP